ncbi:MAG: hypothetical protein IT204_04910 [Fimbriimonadaceae bacterium]|nr:hypothetical protein [Fimbriimonadaceae bacterium]
MYFDGQLDEVRCRTLRRLRHLFFSLLCCAALPAHPIDERFVRYEVQGFVQTGGLRCDLYILHGGMVAAEAWRRHDPRGVFELSPTAQRQWAAELAAAVEVTIDRQPRRLVPDAMVFPGYAAYTECREPIVLRVPLPGPVPRGRPVVIRATVQPAADWPVLARLSFVAPRSLQLVSTERARGAAAVRVIWPRQVTDPDTTAPELTVPSWLWELPESLDWPAIPPRQPTDRVAVAPQPSGRQVGSSLWPAALLGGLAAVAFVLTSRRLGRRAKCCRTPRRREALTVREHGPR